MFKLEIKTCNAAFHDEGTFSPQIELGRLLRVASEQVETGGTKDTGTLMDLNGNRVGTWTLEP